MNDYLINEIAKDTKIFSYEGEPQEEYIGRLVYSAMVQWLKTITLDTGNQDDIVRTKSKSYLYSRGTEILNNIVIALPECKEWFWQPFSEVSRREKHPIVILRHRMLNAGELIESDFKTNVGAHKSYIVPLTENYQRIIGLGRVSRTNEFSIGVTRFRKCDKKEDDNAIILDSCKFLDWLIKKTNWVPIYDLQEYEYFDPLSKSAPYRSWVNIFPSIDEETVILARIKLFNDLHEYYLLKKRDSHIISNKLSEVLTEFKEERRIILALRKNSNNIMKAKIVLKERVVLLKLYCRLPLREEMILETFCWPKNRIDDKINYVIPIELWDYIKRVLHKLKIEVRE